MNFSVFSSIVVIIPLINFLLRKSILPRWCHVGVDCEGKLQTFSHVPPRQENRKVLWKIEKTKWNYFSYFKKTWYEEWIIHSIIKYVVPIPMDNPLNKEKKNVHKLYEKKKSFIYRCYWVSKKLHFQFKIFMFHSPHLWKNYDRIDYRLYNPINCIRYSELKTKAIWKRCKVDESCKKFFQLQFFI